MKRINNLFEQIYDVKNICLADEIARENKKITKNIVNHDKHRKSDILKLSKSFKDLTYKTSKYKNATIYEPKERLLYILPYYPDRIAHHAIMNIMEPVWVNLFISHTYSCIKGRGIHKLANDLKKDLCNDAEGTKYCLKLDIRKFYPSITHEILIDILKKKIKDKNLLVTLEEIIHSAPGVPIGNYLSQFFANLYLTYFDHWVKEELKCKYYYRYADDIVILDKDKNKLKNIFLAIKVYLTNVLNLVIKPNYQIFPVDARGIDYVGYVFFHTHIKIRKSIKLKIKKLIKKYEDGKIKKEQLKLKLSAYFGWLKYCNSKRLLKLIQDKTGIVFSNWRGEKDIISNYYNKRVYVVNSVKYSKVFRINFIYKGKAKYFETRNKRLYACINANKYPVYIKILNI